jgi:hypothetical protein
MGARAGMNTPLAGQAAARQQRGPYNRFGRFVDRDVTPPERPLDGSNAAQINATGTR